MPDGEERYESESIAGRLTYQESFAASTAKLLLTNNDLPPFVVHARSLDMAKVAFNLLGNVFGADKQQRPNTFKERNKLVVFFLGGFCKEEEKQLCESVLGQATVLVGGTSCIARSDIEEQLVKFC